MAEFTQPYMEVEWSGEWDQCGGSFRMKEARSAGSSFVSGAVAGLASVLALQPLDVIKTRLQETPRSAAPWSVRLVGVLRNTWKQDGAAGFWRGTSIRLPMTEL